MEKSRYALALWWPLLAFGCGGFAPRDYGGAPGRGSAGIAGFSYDAGMGEAGRATSSAPRNDPSSDSGPAASGADAQPSLDSNAATGGRSASAPSHDDDGAGQGGEGPVSGSVGGAESEPNAGTTGGMGRAGGHGGGPGGTGGAGGTGGHGNGGTGGTLARGGSAGRAGEGAGEQAGGGDGGRGQDERALLFSEYVAGAHEKALELRALATSSLKGCDLVIYSNGGTSGSRLALEGELAAGDTFLICSQELFEQLGAVCDRKFGRTFNGNDALTLECDGVVLDAIGEVGFDPGTAWSVAGVSTVDQTLRRSCSVTHGDTVATDPFDPSHEWQSYPSSELSGLGSSDCN